MCNRTFIHLADFYFYPIQKCVRDYYNDFFFLLKHIQLEYNYEYKSEIALSSNLYYYLFVQLKSVDIIHYIQIFTDQWRRSFYHLECT